MSTTRLVKFLSLLWSRLASVGVLLGQTTRRESRQLHRLFLKIVQLTLCRINLRPPHPGPSPPPSKPTKEEEDVGHQHGEVPLTSPASLSPYTVVFNGAIVRLNQAAFSINPTFAGDSFRNPSIAYPPPDMQLGSQPSLRLSTNSIASPKSSTSRVPTPSGSAAASTSSLSLCPPNAQESVDVPHYGQNLQLPGRQETYTPEIEVEVVQASNDSPTGIHIPGAPSILSDKPLHDIGPNQLSNVNLQVPNPRTLYSQGSSSRPYSLTSNEPLAREIRALDLKQYNLNPAIPSETLRYNRRKKMLVPGDLHVPSCSCAQ
jgi:hypothetical protein